MGEVHDISPQIGSTSTRSLSNAQNRITNLMGHSTTMLKNIVNQHSALLTDKKKEEIFNKGREEMSNLENILQHRMTAFVQQRKKNTLEKEELEPALSKKEIKNLTKQLIIAKQKIAGILHKTQIEIASEIGERWVKGSKSKVENLAQGGWGSKWIHFLALVSKSHQEAIAAFYIAKGMMKLNSQQVFPDDLKLESKVDEEKHKEFLNYQSGTGDLTRRTGVIGLNGIYSIQTFFSKKRIVKQFKSFIAQILSHGKRTTLKNKILIGKNTYKDQQIPLNKEFDESIERRGTSVSVFTKLFGTRGISSANRQEPHLVNGWETNLLIKGKTIFRALRHAITSDKYEKDPTIRKKNSQKAAKELLKAALLQEISDQRLTLQQAAEKGVVLNLNSVSLVTPDNIRPYLPGQANERDMLSDQRKAFEEFEGLNKTIKLNEVEIPITVQINAFNFGVNYLSTHLGWGLSNQYEHNVKALEGLNNQVAYFLDKVSDEIALIEASVPGDDPYLQQLHLSFRNARDLIFDIERMMKDKKAYLQGDNQYEIGAKILNLSNVMDQTVAMMNHTRAEDQQISGYKCAFNCMSGKDRTGIMDIVAKALAILAQENEGRFPSHEELKADFKLKKRFAEIFATLLSEGTSLEITSINTEVKGYKVGNEARLFGIPLSEFLEAQGLSSTTSS